MVHLNQVRTLVLCGVLLSSSSFPFSELGCYKKVFLSDGSHNYRGPVPFNLQEDPKVPESDKVELEQPSPYKIELEPPVILTTGHPVESDVHLQERIRQENRERKCNPASLCDSLLQVTQQWQASLNVFGSR